MRPSLADAGDDSLLQRLHPDLARWFSGKYRAFSPAQRGALPPILEDRTVLVSAPTGTGKTLSGFLGVFDYLIRRKEAGDLPPGITAVYVSPLRALAYDIQKNLNAPLSELGWDFVRVGTRTGDTSAKERADQKRKPPHILVTTPESLTLMLSQPAWVDAFRHTRFLIIDELHALAENKRGALLMVAAERLEDIRDPRHRAPLIEAGPPPVSRHPIHPPPPALVRIGLSATIAPLSLMGRFLAGTDRPFAVVEVPRDKAARIELFSPLRANPYPPAGWTGTRVLRELAQLIASKRTTLVFTNTRSGAETIGVRLKQVWPTEADKIEVHHASLDRAIRLEVEDRLKRGELRAVVCSTSLEMGIDIGSIDTVVMISAPKGVSRALQRVGRSGHSLGETSHGILVASNVNDLVECTVTAKLMEQSLLESVKIQENPRDVLAQHLVGLAIFESVSLEEAFALVRRAQPFAQLDRGTFDGVVRYLEGGGVSLEKNYRSVFGKIQIVDGILRIPLPRVARDFYQNIGTISTDTMIQVRLGRRNLGQVEENFIRRLQPGDVFVLNGRCVRYVAMRLLTAKVTEAKSAMPTVPRWNANKMPLTSNVADAVIALRTRLAPLIRPGTAEQPEVTATLTATYAISPINATALARHFALQAEVSRIPTADFLLVETYEEGGSLHYFFHSLIGRSANDALSRIIAWRVSRAKGGNALVTIDDYGFLLTVKPFQRMELPELQALFARSGAEADLHTALADSNLVKWHFRNISQTGLMVPRRTRGQERGARSLQFSAEIIFDVLRRHEPDHPLLQEAYAEATIRFLDTPAALRFLESIAVMPWDLRHLDRVSPFSFGIFVSKIKETMTLEDPETTIERLFHQMYGARLPAED